MSFTQIATITLRCDEDGCLRSFNHVSRTPRAARHAARILGGWGSRQRPEVPGPLLDYCPKHLKPKASGATMTIGEIIDRIERIHAEMNRVLDDEHEDRQHALEQAAQELARLRDDLVHGGVGG